MSVDSGTSADEAAATDLDCSLCGVELASEDHLFVQCYPEASGSTPALAAADGFVAVCGTCGDEVAELVDAWTDHDRPAVSAEHSLSAGYRRVAEECSFCGRSLGEAPLLGLERFRERGAVERRPSYANFSLCADCVPVFDEFLEGVAGTSNSNRRT